MTTPRTAVVILAEDRGADGRPLPFAGADAERLAGAFVEKLGPAAVVRLGGDALAPRAIRKGAAALAKADPLNAVVVAVGPVASTAAGLGDGDRRSAKLRAAIEPFAPRPVTLILDPRETPFDRDAAARLVEGGTVAAVLLPDDGAGRAEISGVAGGGLFAAAVAGAVASFEPDDPGAARVEADELRSVLAVDVRRMLRESFAKPRRQRPLVLAGEEGVPWPVAAAPDEGHEPAIGELAFLSRRVRPLRSFRQFTKADRLPTAATASATRFVVDRLAPELRSVAEEASARVRRAGGFTRRQVSVRGPIDGAVAVGSPAFEYHVEIAVDTDEPSCALWTERLVRLDDLDGIAAGRFDETFGDGFESVEAPTAGGPTAMWIDRLEAGGATPHDYAADGSSLTLSLPEPGWTVSVADGFCRLTATAGRPPGELLRRFVDLLESGGIGGTR